MRQKIQVLTFLLLCFAGFTGQVKAQQCFSTVNYNTWTVEGVDPLDWQVFAGGDSLRQLANEEQPGFYVSPDTFMNATVSFDFFVDSLSFAERCSLNTSGFCQSIGCTGGFCNGNMPFNDNDWVGFVISYVSPNSGTANNDYDFWMVDWKKEDQTYNGGTYLGPEGFALIRATGVGIPRDPYFRGHVNAPGYFDIKATDYGPTRGWEYETTYHFDFDISPTRLTVRVDGDTVFDHFDQFGMGKFGFYSLSQGFLYYGNFNYAFNVQFATSTGSSNPLVNTNATGISAMCLGDTTQINFIDTAILGQDLIANIDRWYWDFGDGSPIDSVTLNPNHLYAAAGTYDIQLIAFDINDCSDTAITTVEIMAPPTADFNFTNACLVDSVNFVDNSTSNAGAISTWIWDFDDTDSSNIQSPWHTYTNDGLYDVTLIIGTDSGCADTVTKTITIYEHPQAAFVAPNTCFGVDAQLTDQSTAAVGSALDTWVWDVDSNGTTDHTTQNAFHSYPDSGRYTIHLIVSDTFGCADSTSQEIIVNPKPLANYTFGNVCLGDSMMYADNSTGYTTNLTSWSWDVNEDGVQDYSSTSFSHLYPNHDSIDVRLIVQTDSGCLDTSIQEVVVYPPAQVGFDFTDVCLNDVMSFQDTSIATIGGLDTWDWDFGDGTGTSTVQNPDYLYTANGTYSVKLIVTSDSGCADSVTQAVVVHTLPQVNFTAANVCDGLPVVPQDLSTSINGFALSDWDWDMDNNGSIDYATQTLSHLYGDTGVHTIELRVTDAYGCADSITQMVDVSPGPLPGFEFSNVCLGAPMQFTDTSSIPDGNIVAWSWDFGDTSPVVTQQNPAHFYNSAGSYSITFTVTSDSGCIGVTSGQVSIVVFPLPTTTFAAPDVCLDDQTPFTDQSTVTSGNIVAWDWEFGDNNTSALQNPSHLYATTGLYTVILTSETDNGCARMDTQMVEIFALPEVQFGFSDVCFDDQMPFTDSSTHILGPIAAWDWDFGDGNNSTVQNPNHVYGAPGFYMSKLVATAPTTGCQDSVLKQVQVYNLPNVAYSLNDACQDLPINFVDQSTSGNGSPILVWEWDLDEDNITDYTDTNITQSFAIPSNYNVELKLTDSLGCRDSLTSPFVVHPEPVSSFTVNDVCHTGVSQFNDQSTVLSGNVSQWNWDYGNGSSGSSQSSPNYTYPDPGSYTVTLSVVSNHNCVHEDSLVHEVYHNPVPGFSFSDICSDAMAQFTDTSSVTNSSITNWSWTFGDGTSASTQSPSHGFPVPGNFTVKQTVISGQGCESSKTEVITIHPQPDANFLSQTVCEGQPYTFANVSTISTGAINDWMWDFGDNSTPSTDQDPTHIYASVQPFDVTLVATSDMGCIDSITKEIVMAYKPVANFSVVDTCAGTPFSFQDISSVTGSTVTSWAWFFDDGSDPSVMRNPVHVYDTGGFYDVMLQVESNQGCRDTVTKNVESLVAPMVAFGTTDTSGCAQYPVLFDNQTQIEAGNNLFYDWDFGDGQASDERNPLHIFQNQTDAEIFYDVTLLVTTDNGCFNSLAVNDLVYVLPEALPAFTYQPEPLSIMNGFVQFQDSSYGVNDLYWDFGDGNTEDFVTNPKHQYQDAGSYDVKLSVTNLFGCSAELIRTVVVDAVTTFYIPNSFTPNGDGINDFFFAKGESNNSSYSMSVYDRFGGLIFQQNGSDARWNGKMSNGLAAPQGTYVYRIVFKDIIDADKEFVGSFTLIRNQQD